MTAERDASIVECHRLGLGHAQIARDFGLTRERVRQIQMDALARLRSIMESHGLSQDLLLD
jgi:DNA-directed RNA polymerase sigma subunit (sigma70/sigma32)